ncbi:MAG: hypothetical protein LBS09_01055 [Bacteroidales bacterium]|nr:hypothetical protein [Bacteroidales bacterium]
MILTTDEVIHSYNLPPTLQTGASSNTIDKGPLHSVLERVEKQMLIDALISNRGNISKAAKQLGITERIIGLRIDKYHLKPQDYKSLTHEYS